METSNKASAGNGPKDDVVSVTIDNNAKNINRGTYTLSELKVALGIEENRELLEVKGHEPKPINPNSTIHIEGGEEFISHGKGGGSS
jgi:hypothetical protein